MVSAALRQSVTSVTETKSPVTPSSHAYPIIIIIIFIVMCICDRICVFAYANARACEGVRIWPKTGTTPRKSVQYQWDGRD